MQLTQELTPGQAGDELAFERFAEFKLVFEGFTLYSSSHEFGKPRDPWRQQPKSETIYAHQSSLPNLSFLSGIDVVVDRAGFSAIRRRAQSRRHMESDLHYAKWPDH